MGESDVLVVLFDPVFFLVICLFYFIFFLFFPSCIGRPVDLIARGRLVVCSGNVAIHITSQYIR